MKLRRIMIAAVAAASVIVAAGVIVSFLPTKSGHSVAQTVFGGTAQSTATPAPGTFATGVAGSTTGPSAPARGKSKNTAQDDSLMSAEQPGGATPTPYKLPHPTQPPTTIAAADIAVAAPDSKVATKSISKGTESTQVLLDATTSSAPADTVAYFQKVFTSLGMTGTPVPAVGGSTGIAFTRGTATVTLTVSAHDKGSSYLIHGVLRTGA